VRAAFARWIWGRERGLRHATLSWPLALLLVLVLQLGGHALLFDLRFNNAPEVYFPKDSAAVQLRDALRADFPNDEMLTVLLHGENLFSLDFLRRLDQATTLLAAHPMVDRVSALTRFERIAGSDDGFQTEPLVDVQALERALAGEGAGEPYGDASGDEPAAAPPADPLAALRQRVMEDRFAPGLLVSRDGRYTALAVRPHPLQDSAQRLELKLATLRALGESGLGPWVVADAGPVTLDVAQLDAILRDTMTLVPLTVAVGLAMLALSVGRWRPVVIGGLAMSTVVVPVLAGFALFRVPYTMASAILPSLLAAYTVATLLHLYAGVQRAQRTVRSRRLRVDRAIGETRRPAALNVLTTGAGLLSLTLVPIPPIQVFGIAGAAGTALVFLVVYGLVPPFLRHWDRRQPWPAARSGLGQFGRVARRVTVLSLRRPALVVGVLLLATAAGAPYLARVVVETDLLAFFQDSHRVNVDTRRVEQSLVGVTSMEISLRGSAPGSFQDTRTLRRMQALQQWLQAQPEVDRSVSMVDLLEEMNWAMNEEDAEFRALPATDRLLRQYLLVYDGNDLYELVDRDFTHARIALNLNVHGTQGISALIERIRARVAAEPLEGLQVDIGGQSRMLADQVDLLVGGQQRSFVGAFAMIFVIMALLWRSAGTAAMAMLPNLAPLFFIFVLMGAAGIRLDLATVMIASVVLGITIDDTLHLLHGWRERLRAGVAPVAAVLRSFEASGRAVLATSAVLVSQFGLLAFSDFVPTSNFGLMTATGLLAGLAFEFILLPVLLLAWGRWQTGRQAAPGGRRAPAPVVDDWPATELMLPPRGARPLQPARRVLVCQGPSCKAAGGTVVWQRLVQAQADLAGENLKVGLTKTSCLGPCATAPVVHVYPEDVAYGPVDARALERLLNDHLVGGRVARAHLSPALPVRVRPRAQAATPH
jgi:predicted RND superfamily exporter protein/(2Fe-2S) ferredoxin